MRIFLAFGVHLKWLIYQLDGECSFLNSKLLEEVYVKQPKGFIIVGSEDKVYKLKRALYGLQ